MGHKKWTIEIKLEVADTWIEDGFNAAERLEEIEENLSSLLPYAYGHEFKIIAKVKSAPNPAIIRKLQGYE